MGNFQKWVQYWVQLWSLKDLRGVSMLTLKEHEDTDGSTTHTEPHRHQDTFLLPGWQGRQSHPN